MKELTRCAQKSAAKVCRGRVKAISEMSDKSDSSGGKIPIKHRKRTKLPLTRRKPTKETRHPSTKTFRPTNPATKAASSGRNFSGSIGDYNNV